MRSRVSGARSEALIREIVRSRCYPGIRLTAECNYASRRRCDVGSPVRCQTCGVAPPSPGGWPACRASVASGRRGSCRVRQGHALVGPGGQHSSSSRPIGGPPKVHVDRRTLISEPSSDTVRASRPPRAPLLGPIRRLRIRPSPCGPRRRSAHGKRLLAREVPVERTATRQQTGSTLCPGRTRPGFGPVSGYCSVVDAP